MLELELELVLGFVKADFFALVLLPVGYRERYLEFLERLE